MRLYHNYQLDTKIELISASDTKNPTLEEFSTTAAVESNFPLNINTATASQFEQLPGIGPIKALAIVNYIKSNGSFNTLADIQKVHGIGSATWRKIEWFIVVQP